MNLPSHTESDNSSPPPVVQSSEDYVIATLGEYGYYYIALLVFVVIVAIYCACRRSEKTGSNGFQAMDLGSGEVDSYRGSPI